MNQIDNHFSKKLRDLEIKPSERANELFKSKITPPKKDKKIVWKYFALAASVMLALGVLFALNLNADVLSTGTAVVLPQEQIPPTETPSEAKADEQQGMPVIEEIIEHTEPKPALASVAKTRKQGISLVKNTSESGPKKTETQRLNLVNVSKIRSEQSFMYQGTDLVDYTLIDVIASRLDVESEANYTEAKQEVKLKEKPLIAKVINEVKYLVHGEKLDLERAGIKPAATALAHNQSGLIASETYQFRENVQRIKEIFR